MNPSTHVSTDTALHTVDAYLDAVSSRGRTPMEPQGFQPDWTDQPSRHKTYLGADRIQLPLSHPVPEDRAEHALAALRCLPEAPTEPWDLETLAWVLRNAYGPLNRRLRVTWNQDTRIRELFPEAVWGRGSASGGGMYPLEMYLVTDGDLGSLLPGLYHYSTAHHALEPLDAGDGANRLTEACGGSGTGGTHLVVTTRFWKNAFKYNSFAYHVVTQDLGAFLYCAQVLAQSAGRRLAATLRMEDLAIDSMLGLDQRDETVLALVPLTVGDGRRSGQSSAPPGLPAFERSRRVLRFDTVTQVNDAVLSAPWPHLQDPGELSAHSSDDPPDEAHESSIQLPAPLVGRSDRGTASLLRSRRSSFGAFSGRSALTAEEVATVLAQGSAAGDAVLRATRVDPRLSLFVNRVEGLVSGAYRYDATSHRLTVVTQRPGMDDFLQRNYFLSNYNLHEAAAVVAISIDWPRVRDQFGPRGYRVANAVAGAAGQAVNIAATAVGIASGIVLGFDALSFDELLAREADRCFLFVILGRESAPGAAYRYELA